MRRCWVEVGLSLPSLDQFVSDALHSWETELLVSDPEFQAEFDRLTAETRAALDTARKVTDPWAELEKLPASPRTDL